MHGDRFDPERESGLADLAQDLISAQHEGRGCPLCRRRPPAGWEADWDDGVLTVEWLRARLEGLGSNTTVGETLLRAIEAAHRLDEATAAVRAAEAERARHAQAT